MRAVIEIHGGAKAILFRRIDDQLKVLIEAVGAKALSGGDVCPWMR